MKSKNILIILLFLTFVSVELFARETLDSQTQAAQADMVESSERQSEKELKKAQKEQERLAEKAKKEEERRLKKEAEEKERLKRENEIRQEKQRISDEKKKAAEEKENKKREKQQSKELKKFEKDEKKKLKLQKKEEAESLRLAEKPSSLVLDYDLKFRAASYSNIDYTASKAKRANIYQQYLGINIIGKFDERVELSGKLVSYGTGGKANSIFDLPYREHDENFNFFLESAYLNFKSAADAVIPYLFIVGKQYFTFGEGFIIDSNQNGFLGARLSADINDFFSLDAFAGKADGKDFNIYGGSIKIKASPTIEIGVFQEKNNTGFAWQKGIFTDSEEYAIDSDKKTFYDIRIAGGNKKYEYKLEAARQTGELVKSTSAKTVDYDAFAFSAQGSLKGKLFKLDSGAKLIFSYAQADGDNSFNPTFSRRYNGLQRIGYGALFAAGTSDSFLTLPKEYKGINTLGAGFDIRPWKFLCTGCSFYLFSASDAPGGAGNVGFAKLYGAKADLGNEFDFFVKYNYPDYFDIGLGFAVYNPPDDKGGILKNTETSYLYQIEVSAKF